MFNYTHILKDKEGFEWGAFPNQKIAKLIKSHLELKFPNGAFIIEAIL